MRFALSIVASLMILNGCTTTTDHTQPYLVGGQGPQYDFLVRAANEICVDNIGNADAIDKAARAFMIEEPKTEQNQIGLRNVRATIYPVGKRGQAAGVIAQKEGESCAVIAKQSVEFRKALREALGLEMEDMGASFDFGDVMDLQYGFSEAHNLQVKQYKLMTDSGQLLDVVEFMTPNAFREESAVFSMVSGALARRQSNPNETERDVFAAVIDDVCLPNAGDVTNLKKEAELLSGTTGVQLDRPETTMFADELQIYALSLTPDATGTFIGISEDGGLCGYWAVGAKQEKFDIFQSHDLMQVDAELLDEGLVELGFSPDENVAIFQLALQRDGQQIYCVFVMEREAYSKLNFHDLPVLPWAL